MRRIYSSIPVPSPAPNILGKTHKNLLRTPRRHRSGGDRNGPQSATVFFNQFPNYCQMVEEAKHRARQSIIIDHCGASHIPLNVFPNIEQVYTIERDMGRRGSSKISLIEFSSEQDADQVSKQARHNEDRLMPVPMKIFRYPALASATDPSKLDLPYPVKYIRLSNRGDLNNISLKNYSDLVAKSTMSLVALKMRFITLVNLEQVLCSGLFGAYELMPFGSSVIDTGSDAGDLDLVVTRRWDHNKIISERFSAKGPSPPPDPAIKLLHLDKSLPSSSMDQFGEMAAMKLFETIMKAFMPLTDDRTLFFPQAKVPIIRFKARVTAIDCDLSFNLGLDCRARDILATNYSGIIMSQILYDICRKNQLFTAVVMYLRLFARVTSITSKGPNVGFTNFQLLSLILFYLQRISVSSTAQTIYFHDKDPIIPPFKEIMNSQPIQLADYQLNIVLPKVIRGFFEFYSKFKFQTRSLNLYSSKIEPKPDNSHLYVVNPLDRTRNICHNVCRKGLSHFVDQCKLAHNELSGQDPRECPLSLLNSLLAEYQQRYTRSKSLDLGEVMFEGDNRLDQPPKRLLN